MLTEIKYALRSQRLVRVGIMLPLAVIHVILYFNAIGLLGISDNRSVFLHSFCTLAFAMVCLAGDLMVVREAYTITCLEYMIPKAGWKRLLPRFGVAMFWDLVALAFVVVETLTYDFILVLYGGKVVLSALVGLLTTLAVFFLGYWLLVMLYFGGITLNRTIFAGRKGSKLLSLGGAVVLAGIFDLIYGLLELMQNKGDLRLINFPFFQPDFWQGSIAFGRGTSFDLFITQFILLTVVLIIFTFSLITYLWEKKADL